MKAYKPEIYITYDGEYYYVGQSKNSNRRGRHGKGERIASFPASVDTYERRMTETEMIQFSESSLGSSRGGSRVPSTLPHVLTGASKRALVWVRFD